MVGLAEGVQFFGTGHVDEAIAVGCR